MKHELHLIVEMLVFAIEHHSPATIILITGDRDYAYAMSALRLKQYNVILMAPPGIHQSLKSQASLVIDSNYIIPRKRPGADALLAWHWQPCRDIDEDKVERLVREIRDSYEEGGISFSHSTSTIATIATIATRSQHVGAELLQPSVSQRNTDSSDAAQPAPRNAASIPPEMSGRSAVGSATSWAITTQSTQTVPHIDRDSDFLLTENNALSAHSYAVNAVESRLNEGQAFFDYIVTPPTNNTSPPIAETSGTLVTRESLAPSVSDFDDIMPNVETGSPQTTSVNHSPEYHALPVVSVEKIRRLAPRQFLPLINQLLLARSKGDMRPRRSIIPVALHEDDEDVYKLAGVNKFEDYALLAQEASLIELGGSGSEAWISLHPNLFEEEIGVPESSAPLTVHSDNPSALQDDIRAPTSPTATIPPPSTEPQSTIPNTNTQSLPAVSDKPIPRYLQLLNMFRREG
jgi:hypothetical protein